MSNYKYTFFDNQTVGVDHLNEITKSLVSGGISAVYSGVDFNVADINDNNKAILTGGVVPETDYNLKVTAVGSGKYLINQGLCFFNNGTTMEILSGGEEIVVPQWVTSYIYLVSDSNKMACYVEVLQSEKQTGEFILLAVINADGTVVDKRTYAKGKVPGFYASSEQMNINITETYRSGYISGGKNIEIPIGLGNYKHLCIKTECTYYSNKVAGLFYCDFENGSAVNPMSFSVESNAGDYLYYNMNIGICRISSNIKLQDGKLIIPVLQGNINKGYEVRFSYHLW